MEQFLQALGKILLEVVLPGLATVLVAIAVAMAKKYLKKIGIEVTVAQESRLKELVTDAIHATEEASRRTPMSSEQKEHLTKEQVRDVLPNIDPVMLQKLVDASLTKVRNGGIKSP